MRILRLHSALCRRWFSSQPAADAPTFDGVVSPHLRAALERMDVFAPNKVQSDTIPLALSGRDLLVCAQTGSGKTLLFLLPVLQRLAETTAPPVHTPAQTQAKTPRAAAAPPAAATNTTPSSSQSPTLSSPTSSRQSLSPSLSLSPEGLIVVPTPELAEQVTRVARHLASALPDPPAVECMIELEGHQGTERDAPPARLVVATPRALLLRIASSEERRAQEDAWREGGRETGGQAAGGEEEEGATEARTWTGEARTGEEGRGDDTHTEGESRGMLSLEHVRMVVVDEADAVLCPPEQVVEATAKRNRKATRASASEGNSGGSSSGGSGVGSGGGSGGGSDGRDRITSSSSKTGSSSSIGEDGAYTDADTGTEGGSSAAENEARALVEAAETAGLMDSLLRSLLRFEGDGRSGGNGESEESGGSGDGGSGKGGVPREAPQLLMTMAHLSQERETDLIGRYPGMQVRAVCVYALCVRAGYTCCLYVFPTGRYSNTLFVLH